MNQELENYINEERKLGTSDEVIKQRLRDNGWQDEMFNDYFLTNDSNQETSLKEAPKATNKNSKLMFIAILVIIVLAGGSYFAFAQGFFNFGNSVEEELVVKNEINEIIQEDSQEDSMHQEKDSEEGVVATVFGEKILVNDIIEMTDMLMESNSSFFMAHPTYSKERQVFRFIANAIAAKEAIKQLGLRPKTDEEMLSALYESMTEEGWVNFLEGQNVSLQYTDIFKKMQVYQLRYLELENALNDENGTTFHNILGERVGLIYEAFNRKLMYLSEEEKKDLRDIGTVNNPANSIFPNNDQNYLFNQDKILVKDADSGYDDWGLYKDGIPQKIKDELLSLENSPNILTSIFDDGKYYYFGMVLSPSEFDSSDNFTVEDVLVVRFPFYSRYDTEITDMLLQKGFLEKDIVIYTHPEIDLGTTDYYLDIDGDGLSNVIEIIYNSDPSKYDTDGDGLSDKEEYDSATNPQKNN